MKTSLVILFLIATFYAPLSWAQCATGVDTGGQCIPPDALEQQSNSNQPRNQLPQPRAVWEKRWGAIVIDNATGQAGTVANYASRSEAVDAAMHDCQLHGSAHCKLELAYYNQCAAIAWGNTAHFTGGGPTKQNAESFALQSCNQGTTSCKIAYSDCSLPVRIK